LDIPGQESDQRILNIFIRFRICLKINALTPIPKTFPFFSRDFVIVIVIVINAMCNQKERDFGSAM
jgi:hypothetical protein